MKLKSKNTLVPVFVPKESKHDDSLFVAVNGKRMLIKKGETVMLPAPFVEAVENSVNARREAESFIDSVSKE